MENPSEDIKDVVRELLCKPTPKQQEDTLRRYFKPEARLYNIDLNQEGLDNIIPTYNFALFILNFQDVIFHHILYEQRQNALSLELTVLVRPTTEAFSADNFRVFVLLELEDGRDSRDGRTKKYVKVQRDFFQRDLAIKFLPVIGQVYDSNNLRFLIGRGYAYFFHLLKFGWTTFVPQYLQQVLWEIWVKGPHGPPGECGTDSDKKFAAWVHADDLGDQSTYQPHSIYQPH